MNRTIKLALIRLKKLQRRPVAPPPLDETLHFCRHCGYAFVGRQCPMCGMPGGWTRFTAKKLMAGFLDIWGMGNRPMFRSMGHLLWRPGYMIRDYLGGHYLSYFPPFKMLAVVTVLVAFTLWVLGISTSTEIKVDPITDSLEAGEVGSAVMTTYKQVRDFFLGNTLYRLLLQIVMLVMAVWVVFRKRGLNLVETFFAMVYISCQMQLLTIAWLLLTHNYLSRGMFPYALPPALIFVLLVLDFQQLYRLRFWGAVWRTIGMSVLLILLYLLVLISIVGLLFAAEWVASTLTH